MKKTSAAPIRVQMTSTDEYIDFSSSFPFCKKEKAERPVSFPSASLLGYGLYASFFALSILQNQFLIFLELGDSFLYFHTYALNFNSFLIKESYLVYSMMYFSTKSTARTYSSGLIFFSFAFPQTTLITT